jgi:hypothetical protein
MMETIVIQQAHRPGNMEHNGFNRIARDLDRAFALARFKPTANLLIQHAREESFSKADMRRTGGAIPFLFDPAEFAKSADIPYTSVRDAVDLLILCRVWVPTEDGFMINKDFTQWVDRVGKPLFNAAKIRFILAGKKLTAGTAKATENGERKTENGKRKTEIRSQNTEIRRLDTEIRSQNTEIRRNSHYIEHAGAESIREHLDSFVESADDTQNEAVIETLQSAKQRFANTKPPALPTTCIWPDLLEYARENFGGLEYIDDKIGRGVWNSFPKEWVKRALELARMSAKPNKVAGYITRCLEAWRASGGPPIESQPKPKADPYATNETPEQIAERKQYADYLREQAKIRKARIEKENAERLAQHEARKAAQAKEAVLA